MPSCFNLLFNLICFIVLIKKTSVSPLVIQDGKLPTILDRHPEFFQPNGPSPYLKTKASYGSSGMAVDTGYAYTKIARTSDRLARYQSHLSFLTRCTQLNIIPKGMRLRFGMDALPKSDQLRRSVEQSTTSASHLILSACRDTYRELVDKEQLNLDQLMYDLYQTADYHQYEAVFKHRTTRYVAYKNNLTTRKNKKLNRLLNDSTNSCHSDTLQIATRSTRRARRFKRRDRSHAEGTQNVVEKPTKNTVVNLSSVALTKEQTQVLELGPKFCPTPLSLDHDQLVSDVQEGCRKLRLKELFYDKDNTLGQKEPPKFYKPTGYNPPKGRDQGLDVYCNLLKLHTENYTPSVKLRNNLSKELRKALNELKQLVTNRTIRITPADKGGAIVIQDTQDYLIEAKRQLDNTEHYNEVKKDPTKSIAKHSNNLVHQLHTSGHIDDNTKTWALNDINTVRTHIYYHLPKIHKQLTVPPGRPIISGTGGPTEKLSKLVDHWLQNYVTKLPSHVKDSTDMLNIITNWNNSHAPFDDITLVTIDVTSLYTNIPHSDIPIALRHFLADRDVCDDKLPPTDLIIEATNHVLSNNIFTFENKCYKQVHGTAMGTPMAPAVANLFMGWLEARLLDDSPVPIHKDFWKRYIDDIFLLWQGKADDLNTFVNYMNNVHPTIKFTVQKSKTEIPFLDILVKIVNGKLQTDLYVKPTDANNYLHYQSAHPQHCKSNIPYSQFLRIRRICSLDTDFNMHCNEMAQQFRDRSYPEKHIQKALNRIKKIPRSHTLQYKPKNKNKRVPFIVTHNPRNPPLKQWFHKYLTELHTSTRLRLAIPETPILGERNCRSLRNLLMPSSLPMSPDTNTDPGCFSCHKTKCTICTQHLVQTNTFTSSKTSETFHIRHHMTCETSNVVYLLYCTRCNTQYVGETKNTLKQRFYLHRSNINKNTGTLVTKHFNQNSHSLTDLRCIAIEKQHNNNHTQRLAREAFWIKKLQTLHPYGLNVHG